MGILDDAIREHLELKRKHGAGDDDLERLEKEAFGPPTRPGDPEFEEPAAPGAEAEPVDPAPEAAEPEPAPAQQDAGADGFEADLGDDWLDEPEAEGASEADPGTPAERARIEYADLDDTVDHPAVGHEPESAVEPEAEQAAEAPAEPVEAPESAIFDADEEFGDLDLDLDDDEPAPAAEAPAEEVVVEDSGDLDFELDLEDEPFDREEPTSEQRLPSDDGPPAPEPISEELSLSPEPDTGPHEAAPVADEPAAEDHFDPPTDPGADFPDTAEHDEPSGEHQAEGSGQADAAGEAEAEESLLEETPDFLEDTPEGERLWFEQGKPKDFDFDD